MFVNRMHKYFNLQTNQGKCDQNQLVTKMWIVDILGDFASKLHQYT